VAGHDHAHAGGDHPHAGGDRPHADGTVRRAVTADADAIAQIQSQAWQISYASLLPPDATAAFDQQAATTNWFAAILAPPTGRHRVLVALAQTDVVGFAASAPGTDGDLDVEHDAELLALHVAPGHLRQGHGSRLMAAVVDHARDDGFSRLVCWVFAADDPMRSFLRDNGWDADGSTRDLDVGHLIHQVRLHTSITDPPG
jgi:GNAT superfamily N-acetyltransferase